MNLFTIIIEPTLPYIIAILEIIGFFVVSWSCAVAFYHYIQNAFLKWSYPSQQEQKNSSYDEFLLVFAGYSETKIFSPCRLQASLIRLR